MSFTRADLKSWIEFYDPSFHPISSAKMEGIVGRIKALEKVRAEAQAELDDGVILSNQLKDALRACPPMED